MEPPGAIVAGSVGTWRITFEVGYHGVDDGGRLRLAFRSPADWGPIQTVDPTGPNYVAATTNGEASLDVSWSPRGHLRPWEQALTITVEEGYLREGDLVIVTLGDTSEGGQGLEAQTFCEPESRIRVFVDPFGTGTFEEIPEIAFEVVSGSYSRLELILPTDISIGKPFQLSLRALDAWGNIAQGAPGRVALHASQPVRGLPSSVELPPSSGGILRLDDLFATEPGTLWVAADDANGSHATTNTAIVHETAPEYRAFWGDLHGQSAEAMGANSVESYFAFARDCALIDFTCHQAHCFQTSDSAWDRLRAVVQACDAPGRFVAFLGYEWSGLSARGGDRNVIFRDDSPELYRCGTWQLSDGEAQGESYSSLEDLYDLLAERDDVLIVPHVGGRFANLDWHDERLEPVLEISSNQGQFEWFLTDALDRGMRVGVISGSDDTTGRPGSSFPRRRIRIRGGLACVLARELTREEIWSALRARRCYGTSGTRIALDVSCNGVGMGGEVELSEPPAFAVRVAGSGEIESVELRRGRDRVDVIPRPEEVERASHRVRVSWGGAMRPGRSRDTSWNGRLTCTGTRIVHAEPYGFDAPNEVLTEVGPNVVAWRSGTVGDTDGVILQLDPADEGVLTFETELLRARIDLGRLANEPRRHAVEDGLGLHMTVEREPAGIGRVVEATLVDSQPSEGSKAYYVVVTQKDCAKAWSSPIWVHRR